MERARGLEPLSWPWKGQVMPLYDARALPYVGVLGFEPRLNPPKGLVLAVTLYPADYANFNMFLFIFQM